MRRKIQCCLLPHLNKQTDWNFLSLRVLHQSVCLTAWFCCAGGEGHRPGLRGRLHRPHGARLPRRPRRRPTCDWVCDHRHPIPYPSPSLSALSPYLPRAFMVFFALGALLPAPAQQKLSCAKNGSLRAAGGPGSIACQLELGGPCRSRSVFHGNGSYFSCPSRKGSCFHACNGHHGQALLSPAAASCARQQY
jgi:hypothetical protein